MAKAGSDKVTTLGCWGWSKGRNAMRKVWAGPTWDTKLDPSHKPNCIDVAQWQRMCLLCGCPDFIPITKTRKDKVSQKNINNEFSHNGAIRYN